MEWVRSHYVGCGHRRVSVCSAQVCVPLGHSSLYSLHPAIPVGMWELRIVGFDQPPRCPECVAQSGEWLVMSQGGGELSDGEKHDGVSCW